MGGNDLRQLLELQKALICKDQQRLESRIEKQVENIVQEQNEICDKSEHENNNEEQSSDIQENKENTQSLNTPTTSYSEGIKQQPPFIEPLNLSELNSHEDSKEKKKQAFINRISNLDNPLTFRSNDRNEHKMLRYGEYSPNNPQLRVSSQPYLGIGEYELSRNYLTQQRRSDYLDNLSESKSKVQYDQRKRDAEIELSPLRNYNNSSHSGRSSTPYAVDQKLTTQQNANALDQGLTDLHNVYDVDRRLPSQHQNVSLIAEMDKPKSILSNRRTGSPRDRLMSQMQHSYTPSSFMDGFSYQDKTEEMERERKKREAYQHDLRTQIEENRRLQLVKDEQDRREQELENKRLEQQLLRMQEEALTDEQRSHQREEQIRRHSEDLLRRKHDLQSRQNYHSRSTKNYNKS